MFKFRIQNFHFNLLIIEICINVCFRRHSLLTNHFHNGVLDSAVKLTSVQLCLSIDVLFAEIKITSCVRMEVEMR